LEFLWFILTTTIVVALALMVVLREILDHHFSQFLRSPGGGFHGIDKGSSKASFLQGMKTGYGCSTQYVPQRHA